MDYKKIISEMSNNELKLYKLYNIFEKKFPEKKEFWKKIAIQEVYHSDILKKINENIDNNVVTIIEKYMNPEDVIDFSNYIDDRIENDLNNCNSSLQALKIALLIEEKFTESKLFKSFIIDPKFIKRTFGSLIVQTKEHVQMIRDEIKAVENKN